MITDLTKKAPRTKRVIGLDLSTKSMAFSIFDNKKLVKYGEIDFVGSTAFERLNMAGRVVSSLAEHLEADRIVFEGAVYVQNKSTVIQLAYAYGAIVSALSQDGVEIIEISPMTWQNAIGNKTLTKSEKLKIQKQNPNKSDSWYKNAYRLYRKDRTKQWVRAKFGVDKPSDNLNDAIAVGYVGLA